MDMDLDIKILTLKLKKDISPIINFLCDQNLEIKF